MAGSPKTNEKQVLKVEPLERFVLGNGLELWRVPIALPKEQMLNARVMTQDAFNQLSENIRRESRLESLPLCALIDDRLEIISGHHRLRAARKAGMSEVWVLVDVQGISRDRLHSKQLSHNSLQGLDDADLVSKIFNDIKDSEARIEAFIQMESFLPKVPLVLTTKDLEVEFQAKTLTVVFLPLQHKLLKEALDLLKNVQVDEVFLATQDEYETLMASVDKASYTFNITSVPTILAKMADIVVTHCNQLQGTTEKA